MLLAVGTILALFGLSAVNQQGSATDHLAGDHVAVAAHDAPVLVRPPVSVPQRRAADDAFTVAPDKLFGPKPAAPLAFSVPVHIAVPQAGLNADVTPVGLIGSHSAPGVLPVKSSQVASWYDLSPAPGQLGVSLFGAHVKARTSASVRPGDTVTVTRADHSVAIFTVDKTERVPAWRTRAQAQLAGAAPYPALNLETCSGSLDTARHGCRDHTIVQAHLTGHRALSVHAAKRAERGSAR